MFEHVFWTSVCAHWQFPFVFFGLFGGRVSGNVFITQSQWLPHIKQHAERLTGGVVLGLSAAHLKLLFSSLLGSHLHTCRFRHLSNRSEVFTLADRQRDLCNEEGRPCFFPNNRVSTRAVNWKTKPPKNNSETQTEGGHNGAEYFSVYWSDATASRLISTEEGFSSSVAANSRPWPDISLQTIQSRDVLWEAGRHRLSLTVRQRGSRRSLAHELPKRAKHAFWQRSLTAKGTTTKCHWTMFIFIHEEGSCSMCRLHNYLIE